MPDVEAEGHYGVRVGFSVDSRNWVLGKHIYVIWQMSIL